MVIDVIVWVEGRQRQPGENRWKDSVSQPFPQQAAPLNVVVAVVVATANRVGGKLESPEYQPNSYCRRAHLDGAHCSLGFQRTGKLWRDLHLLTFLRHAQSTSKMFNKIKKSPRLDWFGQMGIKAGVQRTPAVVKHGEPGDRNHRNSVVTGKGA